MHRVCIHQSDDRREARAIFLAVSKYDGCIKYQMLRCDDTCACFVAQSNTLLDAF